MIYLAHKSDDGRTQSVFKHLDSTAKLSKSYCKSEYATLAETAALIHDLGKYQKSFQERINGKNIKVDHSVCGALECERLFEKSAFAPLIEYCVAGHHSGLPDGGAKGDLPDSGTLSGRLRKTTEDYSAYKGEITPLPPDCPAAEKAFRQCKTRSELIELYAFFTKYIFSCLTDADFIDTERFCRNDVDRTINYDFLAALEAVNDKLKAFVPDTAVRKARAELLAEAAKNSLEPAEINILNMPTGSGKTLCSLKIALETVIRENKKRIIYVIPYTSIIEQTADTFSKILGKTLPVLEHHSNFSPDNGNENALTAEKLICACENWDAPLIVTTSVQFFQSLCHYKSSRLRKLHNLSDAIIVFDEIHLIPIEHLQPCIRSIGFVTKYLGARALLLSATMPDYAPLFSGYASGSKVTELIKNKKVFEHFKNCKYINLGVTELETVCQKAGEYQSSLIIVNSRKSAQRAYAMLSGKKYHLSTYMTPMHRSAVIAEIRLALERNEKISVVSTSLVEAGVDLDFETVFRQLAGLDSILQAGGRCNREGTREIGNVFVFETDEKLHGDLQIRANITRSMLSEYPELSSAECVVDYFKRLFAYSDETIKSNSISQFGGDCTIKSIPFKSYAESFEYIKSDTIGIVIADTDEIRKTLDNAAFGDRTARRELQKNSVSVYFYELEAMRKMGIIGEKNGIFYLSDNSKYSAEIGLCPELQNDTDYIN